MGYLVPKRPIEQSKKVDKKKLDASLASVALQVTSDDEGNTISYAQALAQRLWNIALFAEKDKDSITAAKFISERMNGKPAVLVEEEKEEIPAITFRVHTKDAEKVKELAQRDDVEEEPEDDKLVVEIDGEEAVREF